MDEKEKEYYALIARFGRPSDIAYALGWSMPSSRRNTKNRAISRVCMWKHNGIPKKIRAKLERIAAEAA